MKFKKFASAGLLAASIVVFPACKDSSETADAAEDVKEAVEETEMDSKEEMEDGVEETVEALNETAEAVEEDVEEAVEDADAEGSAVAQELMDATYAATEDYADLMASIKDEESAKAALEKFDDLGAQYEKIAEMAKGMDRTAMSQEDGMKMQQAMMEKMQPLQERMQTSSISAMQVLSANPELMKEFQEKSMALAQKMTQMQSGQ